MLDYTKVKKFHATKLYEEAEGEGRVESAFWHTMMMVYKAGVADGEQAARHADERRDKIVGVKR